MGFLGFGKKKDFVDLGKKMKEQQERSQVISPEMQPSSAGTEENVEGGLGFLGNLASSVSSDNSSSESSEEYVDVSVGVGEKKKRLAKRLVDMTEKIEDLSNQIYHLQQRVEVLEKKSGVGNY
jgi:chromosome segregation ATPase